MKTTLVSPATWAKRLGTGLGKQTVLKLIERGILPATVVRGRIKVDLNDREMVLRRLDALLFEPRSPIKIHIP